LRIIISVKKIRRMFSARSSVAMAPQVARKAPPQYEKARFQFTFESDMPLGSDHQMSTDRGSTYETLRQPRDPDFSGARLRRLPRKTPPLRAGWASAR
jgi:hypothetical protein